MSTNEYESLQLKIMEEKADFDNLMDTLRVDPDFELSETMHAIDA